MPARKPTSTSPGPSAPEPPSGADVVERTVIASRDEWEDERIIDADLSGQSADHVRLDRCELQRVVLTGANLWGLSLVDVLAVDCEFSGAILHESSFLRVELRNCRMAGVVISSSMLRHVRFRDCKLNGANFRLANADHVELTGSSLVDADFYEATLRHASVLGSDLSGAEFSKASMHGARLVGSKLDGVKGATSMRGVIVGPDQVLPLGLGLLGDLGIKIEYDTS